MTGRTLVDILHYFDIFLLSHFSPANQHLQQKYRGDHVDTQEGRILNQIM